MPKIKTVRGIENRKVVSQKKNGSWRGVVCWRKKKILETARCLEQGRRARLFDGGRRRVSIRRSATKPENRLRTGKQTNPTAHETVSTQPFRH